MWSRRRMIVAAAGIGFSALVAGSGLAGHHSAAGATRLAKVARSPVAFERNRGQAHAEVGYLARAGRSTLYVTRSRLVLALGNGHATDTLAIGFAHSRPARLVHGRREPGLTNYLMGPDRRSWIRHVPRYAGVRYAGLYSGIDLDVHAGRAAQFEYDFHVAVGADPSRIQLALHGARTVRVAPDGALVVRLLHGTVRQPRPRAWQMIDGVQTRVAVRYELGENVVSFRVSGYDRSAPLFIDPQVVYSSYWGGASAEGCGPLPGPDETMYVVCGTGSALPTVGGVQSAGGEEDVYVAKLDRTGRRLIYATYLGGPGLDEGDAGVVDKEGHLYVSGFAGPGFPTTRGAFDQTFNGDGNCCGGFASDAFIAKLSSDGSRLVYSTYLGGSSGERANILALGRDGSVSATGFTGSADFPTTPGALRSTFGGGSGTFEGIPLDSFAVRLDPAGSRLVYSTYLGGAADDNGNDVAVDDAGNAYYAGATQSADFPTTPGSLQPTLQSGSPAQDAYVTKLDKHGNLVWSTFLGGPQRDRGSSVAIGKHGDVYVSGTTRGDFPVSPDAAQGTFGGGRDWFVAKLDRSGTALDWSTYLGGSDLDGEIDNGMRVDNRGNADVIGMTASSDFPTTPDAFQAHNAGASDIAIAQFDRNGRLLFSSYLGGSGFEDTGGSVPAVDKRGDVFIGGATDSLDFPVSAGAVQATYGGGPIDGLLVEVSLGRDHGDDDD